LVYGVSVLLDAPAEIQNGRLMLPVRAVSGNMGYQVAWDGDKATLSKPN